MPLLKRNEGWEKRHGSPDADVGLNPRCTTSQLKVLGLTLQLSKPVSPPIKGEMIRKK